MKKSESKPSGTNSNSGTFFSKKSDESFFGPAEKQDSFFTKSNSVLPIQAKLTVGAPGDAYEKQADSMADKLVQRSSNPSEGNTHNHTSSILQFKCDSCDREEKLQQKELDVEAGSVDRVHKKPIFDSNAEREDEKNIQRKCADCEAEEKLQKKSEPTTEAASPQVETTIQSSKGSGAAMPKNTRHEMESFFNADFSDVRIHNDGNAADMNKDLHAQAFTHGSDIYFSPGKYDTNSSSGKHLLAHELTHVVQQNGSSVQKKPEGGSEYLKTNQKRVQRWDIPWADGYELDLSWDGVKTAAGYTADKVEEGATWVKDRAVDALEWIFDKIKGLIDDGFQWLKKQFSKMQEFANSVFDKIIGTLKDALSNIGNPLELLKSALSMMSVGLVRTAWNALKSGANLLWQILKGTIDGFLGIAGGLWDALSGFVDTLFDGLDALMDNWAFRHLPDFMQDLARGMYNAVHAFWITIRDFWNDFWKRFTTFIHDILDSIEKFVNKVVDFAIDTVIKTVQTLKEVYDFVSLLVKDPEAALAPLIDGVSGKINKEAPGNIEAKKEEKMEEALSKSQASGTSGGIIQKAPDGAMKKTRASRDEVNNALEEMIGEQFAKLEVRKMVWDTIVNMFWPPATIRAIGNEFYELWTTDWADAVDSLHAITSPFDDIGQFFADIWENFLTLFKFPLALWRRLNNVLMLLMGYVTILLVLIGIVGGAIVGGGVPGALAGAIAGAELAWAIGEALFLSFILAESSSALWAFLELFTSRQTEKQKQRDYIQITSSVVGMGIAIVIALIFMLLGALVKMVVAKIRGAKVAPPAPPKQLGPGDQAPPADQPKVEPPKEEPKTEKPKEEQKTDQPKDEPKPDEPKPDQPKEEPKPDQPKDEPKGETPKDEPKTEPSKEEPKPEAPKEEPKPETPKDEPKVEPPKEEPKLEPPKEDPKLQPPTEEPKVEPPKDNPPAEEPKTDQPTEEPKTQPPAEEPKTEPPSDEPAPPKEAPKTEPPKEEPPKQEPPKEKPKKEPKKGNQQKPQEQMKPMTPEELTKLKPDELAKRGTTKKTSGETDEMAKQRVEEARAEAKRRGYCFVAGTVVQTPEGPIPIEDLRRGAKVFARHEDANSVDGYLVLECLQDSTRILYHLEISANQKIITTRNHPIFVIGRGWIRAKDLHVGDELISIEGQTVLVTNISREKLLEPVNTYNLIVSDVHTYFVGDNTTILVHNGTPLNDPGFNLELIWGFGTKGPKARMPSPGDAGDADGASGWRTNSVEKSGELLGIRNLDKSGQGNHGAVTDATLKAKDLIAVDTPGTGPLADAGFQHVSIRPIENPDPKVPLTEEELTTVNERLKTVDFTVQAKGTDFLC